MKKLLRWLGLMGLLLSLALAFGAVTTACSAAPSKADVAASAGTGSGSIPWIELQSLPREARELLPLIDRGGPFKYKKDGVVFRNAERRLPSQPSGYYHEYTVDTPGSKDRGARRIITGKNNEFYYTGDHYRTFARIRR